jgi:hypothetical protein
MTRSPDLQSSQGIDPQMVRDHQGDEEDLHQSIREIELEALREQDRLKARPMPKERHSHWWRRSA